MYKVLIVDDEDIIVRGLVSLMKWEENNCKVVATANNGNNAYDLIKETNPDIMFTDICMPKMGGLDLIEKIRTDFPFLKITILSGYSEFDYAKKAIELGVSRYILKPSKFDELQLALKIMVQQLDAEKELREASKDIKEENREPLSETEKIFQKIMKPNRDGTEGKGDNDEDIDENDASQNFIIKNAIKYMEEHFAEKMSLTDVAENVYVSQWHLSKLIAKTTEHNFYDILNRIRIEKAKNLLMDPALRVWEISDAVGFNDVTHFSKVFKKIEGESPNEYRNNAMLSDNIEEKVEEKV